MPSASYTVSLTRVTGVGQIHCTGFVDMRSAVITSSNRVSFISLEEFSVYVVTISIMIGTLNARLASKEFTTLSASNDSLLLRPPSPSLFIACRLNNLSCDVGRILLHNILCPPPLGQWWGLYENLSILKSK